MYQELYHTLNQIGWVKTGIMLNGKKKGSRCMKGENQWLMDGEEWTPYLELLDQTEETKVIRAGELEIFVEIFISHPWLIVLGGGHVSQPVVKIGKMLGFHVIVMDDREEFLTEELFPDADLRIKGSFEELSEKIPPYQNAYYVVVTRGHRGDSICAQQILGRPYTYLGMIGSKTKVRLCREKLLKEGFTQKQLDTIHAPIGLPIGGQLPEEIAVSIMAEIVQVKNQNYTAFVDEKISSEILNGKHGVMVTIAKKSGSSPRGIGSKMFLEDDKTLFGSIGGGSVEFEAMKRAEKLDDFLVKTYDLSIGDQQNLGMICGGKVEVFFERV